MQDALQRLYKTKLVLAAIIAVAVGAALLFLAHWVAATPQLHALRDLPIADVGSALFTSGLIAIFFEYLDQRDAELRAMQRLRTVLKEEAPAIRDSVVDGFAFAPDSLTNVAAPAVLDRIVENCLAIQLSDKQLAHDVYTDLKAQVQRADERYRDLYVSVSLAPWADGPMQGDDAMYVATLSYEYRVVPKRSTMRFACVSDPDEYRDLVEEPGSTLTWNFRPVAGLTGGSSEAFRLTRVAVDGQTRPVGRSVRGKSQFYTATLDEKNVADGLEVTIAYTFSVLVPKNGHLLQLEIARPTKGFHIDFAYSGCGIQRVNALDYVAAAKQPTISQVPADAPSPSISLSFDGWVMPKGGVGFVWVLGSEVAAADHGDSAQARGTSKVLR